MYSNWLCSLRRGCVAAHLLELWVRIPLRACKPVVSVVSYQVEVSALG